MSHTNLVRITKALIVVDKELHIGEQVTLFVEGEVVGEAKKNNKFNGEIDYIAEVQGSIVEVRSQTGKVISEENEN